MARTMGPVALAVVDAALAGDVGAGVHPPERVPGLLARAEVALVGAGVAIERDAW